MSGRSRVTAAPRRSYDSPERRRRAAETRARIINAAAELVHGFASWDWRGLTFRAVAERAGVGERTVYRHFPTERHLHDAVMAQLEHDAGITYEDVDLDNLTAVTGRVFASLQRFSVRHSTVESEEPAFVSADTRRREALARAVAAAAPQWSTRQKRAAAGLLDVLWNLPSYERLAGSWELPDEDATAAIGWLIDKVITAIEADEPPPGFA
jgi:AcrR family transcriptional regulator